MSSDLFLIKATKALFI